MVLKWKSPSHVEAGPSDLVERVCAEDIILLEAK